MTLWFARLHAPLVKGIKALDMCLRERAAANRGVDVWLAAGPGSVSAAGRRDVHQQYRRTIGIRRSK